MSEHIFEDVKDFHEKKPVDWEPPRIKEILLAHDAELP